MLPSCLPTLLLPGQPGALPTHDAVDKVKLFPPITLLCSAPLISPSCTAGVNPTTHLQPRLAGIELISSSPCLLPLSHAEPALRCKSLTAHCNLTSAPLIMLL